MIKGVKNILFCAIFLSFSSSCKEAESSQKLASPFDRFENEVASQSVPHANSGGAYREFRDHGSMGKAWDTQQINQQTFLLKNINRCHSIRHTCVVDGDTLWLEGMKFRVADIDTPEIGRPKCEAERRLGVRATDRFIELLNAGPVTIASINGPDEDRFGRKLRVFLLGDRSIGQILVREGLAREWTGKQLPWC